MLRTRIVSALVAVAIIVGLFLTLRIGGLKLAVVFAVVVGGLELEKIFFGRGWRSEKSIAFLSAIYIAFFGAVEFQHQSLLGLAISLVLVGIFALIRTTKFQNLDEIQDLLTKTTMGALYVGIFPAYVYFILGHAKAEILFFGLLAIVFAGDVVAYLVGSKFGKRKLLESISPKKTLEGSIGGLIGSGLIGVAFCYFMGGNAWVKYLLFSLVIGAVAQAGDLFESLFKRVGNQKDSGALMPGHGGVLDRLDGVIFAAPVFYMLFVA